MKLADKRCYPLGIQFPEYIQGHNEGLTFRERLIIALASNPNLMEIEKDSGKNYLMSPVNATRLINQADKIIKCLESEKK